eukprot:PITA_16670
MVGVVEELAQQWDLQDFNPTQGRFTWSNNRTGTEHISARLDRFLVQTSLLMNKKIITTKILPKLSSDHKPIQLCLEDEEDLGPIPFRFSPQWIEREGFFETVKTAWASSITSSPSFIWEQKLKLTKKALKEWIKKPVQNPTSQRVAAIQALHTLQNDMESKNINEELLDLEKKAQRAAYQSFRKEEEYWRLKSRSLWLKAGDRNTSFFHRQYRARLSRNFIAEIKTSTGQICKGFQQVKEAAETHFQNLYNPDAQGEEVDDAEFLTLIPSLISPEDNSDLCKLVSEEEIIKIIWSMDSDKAPGPDGFTIHFYKVFWDIIKYDLQKMVRGFMNKAKVGGSTNSTYLALIPKDSNPETFARFRPISLCNASYKILAKLLANRIKPLLPRIISSAQGGFVEGRHILDNVIQVQETIHSSKQRKEKGILIKLDMANAFDKVNRSFLSKVLLSFGFSSQFVNLIKACMSNPWIAPLINGRPTNFFKAKRGIRQGCLLSPFLYILMAEALSRKLKAKRVSGSLPGLKPTSRINPLNHALFADDSILLGGASSGIAKAFDTVIKNYCKVSGALVNEKKSEVFSWNINQQELNIIANILGFKGHSQWDRIRYLCLPIISGVNKRSLWSDIIGKFKTKISKWGGYWLTKGGKVILIKSQLSSLIIYQAAFLLAPRNVMEQISSFLRNFLWQGGRGNDKKLHLVNWDTVKKPINEGGLQIREPSLVNLALRSKILWKMIKEPLHPVSAILRSKYTNKAKFRILQLGYTTNRKHTIFDISNWDHRYEWTGWAIPDPPAHLQTQINSFLDLLEDVAPIHRSMKDRWGWGHTGEYTTAEGYKAYQTTGNNKHSAAFWKNVWEPLALPKVNFFFWMLMHNKLLTGDNMAKRKFAGPHWCALCRCNTETAQHLFIDCLFAKEFWDLMLQDFRVSSPSQITVSDLFAEWNHLYPQRIPHKSLSRKVWNALPKFVCWKIWLACNQKIINDLNHTPLQVAAKARTLLLEAAQQQYYKEDTLLQPVEKRWLGTLELQSRKTLLPPQTEHPIWKKRDPDETFQLWWRAQKSHTIFFDGASKGNPGPSGAEGLIFSPDGVSRDTFFWGLGLKTNNQAELLSLLKACQIAREKGIKDIQVFGDSKILIKKLNAAEQFRNAGLNRTSERLKKVLSAFASFKFYHILRSSDSDADLLANKGSALYKGLLFINEDRFVEIPC